MASARLLPPLMLAAAAALSLSSTAHAEPKIAVDLPKLMVGLDHYVRTGSEGQAVTTTPDHLDERLGQPFVQNAGNAWFGVAPSVSLVARDWGSAYRLAGDRLSLLDAMRLSESTRMVMSRFRLSNFHVARVTPFAQLGFGQWRTDTNILPLYKRSLQIAAQVGGGVEMQLAGSWQLAAEVSATSFIRDEREVEDLPATRMWSATIFSKMTF